MAIAAREYEHYEYIPATGRVTNVTLVLLHGLCLDRTSWDSVLPILTESYNVIRYDCPVMGRTLNL